MLTATTKLNAEARAKPGGAANLQLGYLLGAARRGADGTEGIHAELIRRLSAAARYSPDNRPLPPAFSNAPTEDGLRRRPSGRQRRWGRRSNTLTVTTNLDGGDEL